MLCSCANIKAKKFKFYHNFDVQLRNNHVFENLFALLEASYSIKEDFVLIVRNIIVTLCCCCFKHAFSSVLLHTLSALHTTHCTHIAHIAYIKRANALKSITNKRQKSIFSIVLRYYVVALLRCCVVK